MSVYHDGRLQNRQQKLFALLPAKHIHESDFPKVTLFIQAMSSYSPYSLMTVNMHGKTKVDERRALLSKIITSSASSLVFCQELPGFFDKKVVRKCGTCVYDLVRTAGKEAAVMWSEAHFYGEPVDAAFKTKILDKVDASQNFRSDEFEVSEITARTAVVKLTSKSEACSFLAVSWHGPSKMKLEKKRKVLKALILFLQEICRKKNLSSIIIGGDFNLNTLDENGLNFPWYELTSRAGLATGRKRPGHPYIPYKDNFVIITISPSVGRPFVDMKLSKVKPLSEFNYVKEEGSERGKDILDHDPIIGVLQLQKSPSEFNFVKEEGSQGSLHGTRRAVGFAWGSDFFYVLVRLILYFLYITNISGKSEKGKDILDHDPIIGFLQLRKTPSTGKFWLT